MRVKKLYKEWPTTNNYYVHIYHFTNIKAPNSPLAWMIWFSFILADITDPVLSPPVLLPVRPCTSVPGDNCPPYTLDRGQVWTVYTDTYWEYWLQSKYCLHYCILYNTILGHRYPDSAWSTQSLYSTDQAVWGGRREDHLPSTFLSGAEQH